MATERGSFSILVVDDDVGSRHALAEILSCAGYTVTTAGTGREAMERVRNSPGLSLIILDLLMPDVDGHQFLERRRREPDLARVPVIVMSGLDEQVDAHAQVPKPVDIERLLKLIRLMHVSETRASHPVI